MIKRILLGLLVMPCVSHGMEKEYYACNYENAEVIVYSLGNPDTRFEQVTYNKKEKELPVLVTLLYSARTTTMGSKSQGRFDELRAAYQKRENPVYKYENAEVIVYSLGNPNTRFEQVTYNKKEKGLPVLVTLLYGSRTTTMGSKSESRIKELKTAYDQQQQEIEEDAKGSN